MDESLEEGALRELKKRQILTIYMEQLYTWEM